MRGIGVHVCESCGKVHDTIGAYQACCPTPTTSAERGQDAFSPLRCPKCHLAFEGAEGQTLESLAAECGIGHHTDTADGCPMDAVPPSAERVRAAAVAYRAAQRAIDDDPEVVPDDDPRWGSFMAASRSFTEAVGFGFACEAEDVADLLMAILPEQPSPPGAERVAALEAVAEALKAARAFRFSVHEGALSTDAEWEERNALWDAVDAALATLDEHA